MNQKFDKASREAARQQEEQDEYRLIPLAIFFLIAMTAAFYLASQEHIEVKGVLLFGPAKYLWALTVELFYGLGILVGTASLVLLFWLSAMAKHGKFVLHPWRPIIMSSILLLVCLGFWVLAQHLEHLILGNVLSINKALEFERELPDIVQILLSCGWAMVAAMLANILAAHVLMLLYAPFDAKETIKLMREEYEQARSRSSGEE